MRHAGPAVEVQPRLATMLTERWPVEVSPAQDELLSSWLHRLAFAHGLSPRHFGECLGFGAGAWSARLDLAAPEFLLDHLQHQTGAGRERIIAMTIGAAPWRALLLPLRRSRNGRTGSTWLQFCPLCLAEDETPYFRRSWRRASVMTCRRHGRALLDRCPSCRKGLAPFAQRALSPQHRCAGCGFNLREAKAPFIAKATRQAAELIDDLVRLEAAKDFLEKSALIERILALPALEEPPNPRSFTRLSTKQRLRCLARLARHPGRPLQNHLCAEPDALIAGWRGMIVAAGGTAPALEPLLRRLASRAPIEQESGPGAYTRRSSAAAADLRLLLSAYGAICARNKAPKPGSCA
jgi:hypothetical protein